MVAALVVSRPALATVHLVCTDGDPRSVVFLGVNECRATPACDVDAARNGSCTFRVCTAVPCDAGSDVNVRTGRRVRMTQVVIPGRGSAPALLRCRRGGRGTTTSTVTTTTTTSTTTPTLIVYADPCRLRCDMDLCISGGDRLSVCGSACDPNRLHLDIGTGEVVADTMGLKVGILCEFVGSPCFPCVSDAECDDGNSATRDVCYPLGDGIGSCRHLCPQ